MSVIYNRLFNKIPFCFIRFNDGEISAMLSTNAVVSRGSEVSSKEMSDELYNIITDKYENMSLFIGIPCILCYREYYNFITNELIKYKSYDFNKNNVLHANILINNNYDNTFDILINTLKNRYVIVIAGETAITHIDRLSKLIPVSECYPVADKCAFTNNYNNLKELSFRDDSVIITLCGPLGRIICYNLYKNNESLTCIDLGSFFDPMLQERAFLYHTNTHKYCSECYPIGDKKYAKIFDYCKDITVKKECYYINNIQDNFNLYNHDYTRIINNTLIRLEKEPDNIFLYCLLLQCKQLLLFNKSKLSIESNLIKDILNTIKTNGAKYMLELGPGPSIETVMLLECSNAQIAYYKSKNDILISEYPDRIIEPDEKTKYDIIYINSLSSNDVIDLYKFLSSYLIIYKQSNISINSKYVKKYESNDIIIYKYDERNINYLQFIEMYESTTINHKINAHILETIMFKQLKENNLLYSNEGYIFQIPEMFNDIIDIVSEQKPNNILEIGFLYGSSALMFLACTNATLTSIDIIYNDTVQYSENYLNILFPNRFNFICSNSNDITECTYESSFDIVFIDGSHEYEVILNDIFNLIFISTDNTIFILNDVVFNDSDKQGWNINPTNVVNNLIDKDVINVIFQKTYCIGRGIVVFKIKKKAMIFSLLNKSYILTYMNNLNNSKNYNNLVDISSKYLDMYKIILTNKEYKKILSYSLLLTKNNIPKIIHIVYINQRPLQSYNYKCIQSIINHMKNYRIIIHNDIEPESEEWNKIKSYPNVEINKINRYKSYKSYTIHYVQYETDIIRLEMLYKYGGIYLDTDIFLFKNFENILNGSPVYYNTEMKDVLTNCVLISEPNNEFIKTLLDNIHLAIQTDSWAWHIRDFPKILIENNLNTYNVELINHIHFCSIHWTELKKYTELPLEITDDMYGLHLYDTIFGETINSFSFMKV